MNVAVGVLINDDRHLLIAQRPVDKNLAGFWEFPGGKIEAEETPFQALCREFKEELGITLSPNHTTLVGHVSYQYSDFLFQAPLFIISYWKGQPQPLERQKLAWVSETQLKEYTLLPSCEAVLKLLHQKTDLFQILTDSVNVF